MTDLNELEFVNDRVFANIYLTTEIARLDLNKNLVEKVYDFSKLYHIADQMATDILGASLNYDECLNGIAYDATSGTFLLTGKNWPVIFDVQLDARS